MWLAFTQYISASYLPSHCISLSGSLPLQMPVIAQWWNSFICIMPQFLRTLTKMTLRVRNWPFTPWCDGEHQSLLQEALRPKRCYNCTPNPNDHKVWIISNQNSHKTYHKNKSGTGKLCDNFGLHYPPSLTDNKMSQTFQLHGYWLSTCSITINRLSLCWSCRTQTSNHH